MPLASPPDRSRVILVLSTVTLWVVLQAMAVSAADVIGPAQASPSPAPTAQCDQPEAEPTASPATVADGSPAASGGTESSTVPLLSAGCSIGDRALLAGASSPAPETGPTIAVEAREFWFDPKEVVVSASGPTTIQLRDTGIIAHNFTVDALGIQIVAAAGRTSEATFQDLPPGTYEFYCSISGHRQAGMSGILIVQ